MLKIQGLSIVRTLDEANNDVNLKIVLRVLMMS